jgi:hypothetical protein
MSQSAVVPTSAGSPAAPGADETVLRVGWIALTVLVLTLNAIAIPRADALLQVACQPGPVCISGLTSADLRQLQQSGVTPGFLAAYQIAWAAGTTLLYTTLAALIFWRRSAGRMALFCAYMLVLFGGATYTNLLDVGLRTVAPAWYWLVGGLELLAQVCVPTFFLLFPSGRFVPRWSRWYVLVIALYEVWVVLVDPFSQGPALASLVFPVLILGIIGLQVYRYRRVSTFRERQQTKWVVFGLAAGLGGIALIIILANLVLPQELLNSFVLTFLVIGTVTDSLLLLIPISIAIAILRAQLYDIDTLINKALVYGLLTGILAALYAGLIIGLESVAGLVIHQAADPIVLVISTLAVAALFQPLRRRIQAVIDRRFYRRKYDAEKILAAFSETLRNEVDLSHLRKHLLEVVQETMQPAHVSLWLRQPGRLSAEEAHRLEPRAERPSRPSVD